MGHNVGYSFDEKRQKFIVRETIDGKRKYIGQYDTEYEAQQAHLNNSVSELQCFNLDFEEHDEGFSWLEDFRKWNAKRKLDREIKRRETENINRVKRLARHDK